MGLRMEMGGRGLRLEKGSWRGWELGARWVWGGCIC